MLSTTVGKTRIGILFADATERTRCAEYVAALGHEAVVSTPAKARFDEWAELSVLIADASAAERRGPDLKALKDRSAADFRYLPFVIALPIRVDFAPWFSFGFDDVLRTPVQREALRVRIEIWLRLREEAERHYRSLVEGSPIGIYRMTPDGRLLYASPALVQMLGFPSFEELDQRDQELQLSSPHWPRSSSLAAVGRSDRGIGTWLELPWIKADGTQVHVRETARPIRDATGRVLYYEGMVEDVTARVELEERMAAIRELGRTLVLARSEPEIAQATVEAARDVLRIEDCELFLVEPDERKLVFAAHTTGHTPPWPVEFSLDAERGIMAAVARTGEMVCLPDVTEDPRYIGGALRNRSELCVPVRAEKKVLGVLNAESPIPGRFGPAEKQLLDVLASQAATAIANVRLFAEVKRVQGALSASERLLADFTDHSTSLIYALDSDGRFLFVNRRFESVLGVSRESVLGRSREGVLPPEVAATHRANDVRVLESGKPMILEERNEELDGEHTYFSVKFPLLDSVGNIYGVGGISTDITALKESQRALHETERQLRNIVEHSTNMFYAHDVNHVLTYVSPQSRHFMGCEPEEAMRRWTDFVTDNPINENGFAATERAIETGQPQPPYELELRTAQGNTLWVEVHEAPVVVDGKTIAIVGSLTDITERKRAEEALHRSEAQYRELVEEVNDVIFSVAGDGVVTYISPAIKALSGYAPEEIVGKPFASFIHREDLPGLVKTFQAVLSGRLAPFEYRVTAKSGEPVWVRSFSKRFFEGDRVAGMRGVMTDISARKQAEEERARNHARVQGLLESVVQTLESTVRLRDPYTAGHQERVAELACAIGRDLGLPQAELEGLRITALVHDIGKTVVPAEILSKPGKLTQIETTMVRGHVQAGYDVLEGIEFPWPVAVTVLQHHERLDGSGYPQGLKGEEISLWARILAVADVVEAMSSHRPYRPALGLEKALAEIESGKGSRYDPAVVDACQAVFRQGFAFSLTD